MAATAGNLLDELENSLAHGTVARRVETLRKITDLFLINSATSNDEQVAVFDDVFDILVRKIEHSAKVLLAERLAPVPTAPPRVIHRLAFDDSIDVAAPVLTQSDRLTDETLIENARSKSQAHLLAISKRKALSPAVTDVLVDRGDSKVVDSVARNLGAEFSEQGYSRLLEMSERDDDLATTVGSRPSIPRHHFVTLLTKASNTVRTRLQAQNKQPEADIPSVVAQVTTAAHDQSAADSAGMVKAQALVEKLHRENKLTSEQIGAFAEAGQFEETNAAFALLANMPVAIVETMMVQSQSEGVMVLAKVAGLEWPALKSVIEMRTKLSNVPAVDMNFCKVNYARLKMATAQQVLRFHRMRSGNA